MRYGRFRGVRQVLCFVAVVAFLAIYQCLFSYSVPSMRGLAEGTMDVHFMDVGQADCTLIRTEDGHILIDTGDVPTGDRVARYLRRARVERLSYLILTHPDSDHIGGAAAVLSAVPVDRVILPRICEEDVPETDVYQALVTALAALPEIAVIEAVSGEALSLGDVRLTILAPNADDYEDINDYSVAIRVDFGQTSLLFTGDAMATSEAEMLARYPDGMLDCTLFQAAHHGANTSNTRAFLAAVSPETVVISCGANSFGHPSGEALAAYALVGAEVFRTCEEGTMIFVSDGKEIRKK